MVAVLQIAGMVAAAAGVFMIYIPAGLITAGVFLMMTGIALERSKRAE